jgi:hypothetical protein
VIGAAGLIGLAWIVKADVAARAEGAASLVAARAVVVREFLASTARLATAEDQSDKATQGALDQRKLRDGFLAAVQSGATVTITTSDYPGEDHRVTGLAGSGEEDTKIMLRGGGSTTLAKVASFKATLPAE